MAKRLTLIILFFAFAISSGVMAQVEAGDVLRIHSEQRPVAAGKTPLDDRLQDTWQQVLSSVKDGRLPDAQLYIQQMINEARSKGAKVLPHYAWAALTEEIRAWGRKDTLKAQFFLKAARDMGKGLPEPDLRMCVESWHDHAYGSVVKYLLFGVANILKRGDYNLLLLGNFFLTLLGSIYWFAFVITLIFFLKYMTRVWHDIQERLGQKVPSYMVPILGAMALFLPFILGFDYRWQCVFLMVVIYGYLTRAERVIVNILLLIGIMALPMIYLLRSEYRVRISPVVEATAALNRGETVYSYIGNVETVNNIVGLDPDLFFLLGNLYERSGDTINAMASYRKAFEKSPRYVDAYLNLGNLYFWQNQFETAIAQYKDAINADSTYIPAYYNLYKSMTNNYQYEEGQHVLRDAQALDSGAIQSIMNHEPAGSVVRKVFSVRQARKEFSKLDKMDALRGKEIRGHVKRDSLLSSLLHPFMFLALLGLLAMHFLHRYRMAHGGYAGVCVKCGNTFCSLCKQTSESQIYCSQCIHIYIKKDGVPLDVKVKKINEVKRHIRLSFYVQKLVNFLIPGSLFVFRNSVVKGAISIFITILCLVIIFVPFLFPQLIVTVMTASFLVKGAWGLLALTWVICNFKSLLERKGV